MVGRDNVTFSFRIDSAKAQATLRQLEAAVKKVGGTAVTSSVGLDKLKGSIDNTGNRAAASAVNFQTATQGMLNLSTAAVQTYTSISNLDRANNRAKMSIIAVARAEDLLNNKVQRLKEMTDAGTTSGGKYANMQREIATATADLTVKQEKQEIEQAAVNDIYMLFASNIANVVISSMQTISILLGQEKTARLGVAAATKLQTLTLRGNTAVMLQGATAQGAGIIVQRKATFATILQTKATMGLTVAVRSLMTAAWPLLAVTVALTAAFAIHESNVLGTKTALDKLLGVEKDFESQVKEGRDGIEDFDDSLGKLNSTVGSSLPDSFESATKVMIAYTNSIRENTSVVENNIEAQVELHNQIASGKRGTKQTPSNIPPLPQVQQGRGVGRPHFSTPSGGGQNEALANALSATGAFLMADPFAGSYGYADRGDNRGRELIAIEEKAQVESRRGKISTPSPIAAAAQPTPESFQGDQGSMFKQGADMNNQFTLHGHSGGISNIPAIQDLAKDLGVSVESLEGSLSTGEFSIKQLQIANQILSGDLMTIKHVKDFVKSTKFKQFTPELESDRLALEKAKEQDKNFASIFRERYMGTGVSIDKTLLELGKLEPDRKRRLDNKNKTFIDGIAFDLTTERGLKAHQKYMQAKLGQLIPTVDPLDFAGIKDKQKEITEKQYLRLLGAQGLQQGNRNVVLNKNQNRILNKIRSGEIKGNRAEVLINTGLDIGNAVNNYSIEEAMRIGKLQLASKEFQGIGGRGDAAIQFFDSQGSIKNNEWRKMGALNDISAMTGGLIGSKTNFGTGFFKSTGATAAYQVPRGSIRASDEFYARIAEQDRITNLKRFGGYSSRKAQSEAGKAAFYSSVDEASRMMRFFGDEINSSVIRGRSSRRSEYGRIANKGAMYKSALASAGLGYKTINTRLGSRPSNTQIFQYNRDLAETISYNTNQYAKAETINILQQDFGLTGFTGTTMSLPSLQDRLAAEDERMKSIGLDRTEAFQIVDTVGRGREEIDDRILWKDRLNNISTGNTVL